VGLSDDVVEYEELSWSVLGEDIGRIWAGMKGDWEVVFGCGEHVEVELSQCAWLG